jgi:energy-coupling factor transport system permease protein
MQDARLRLASTRMHDARLRLASTIALSIAAYMSVLGAAGAALWWLVVSRGRIIARPRAVLFFLALIAIVAMAIEFTGGDGLSYGVRMSAILLVATWAYGQHRPGDLLDVACWALGSRRGFELGLVAEMSLQSITVLGEDFRRIRLVQSLKGIHGVRAVMPAAAALLAGELRRADEQAKLLAVRGYRDGRSQCPTFDSTRGEQITAGFALTLAIASIFAPSDIFILLR